MRVPSGEATGWMSSKGLLVMSTAPEPSVFAT